MFAIGLLIRGYALPVAGIDVAKLYLPHGFMVGAGIVALIQVMLLTTRRASADAAPVGTSDRALRRALGLGGIGYIAIAMLLAAISGLVSHLSPGMLLAFILYAAFAAFVHELIVGIAAMHAGWFPAFAVALITLIIGVLIGFPPVALGLLVGFAASTGPAFADMGYDLKAGFMLRGQGANSAFELDGRKQQLYAAMIAFVIAIPTVWLAHPSYFAQNLVPPVDRVYVATIQAGATSEVARAPLLWAIPSAVIQFLGGPQRQLGVLLATGLLIPNDWNVVGTSRFDALGLVPWTINPHYLETDPAMAATSETRDERIHEYLLVNANPVIGIEENTALRIEDGRATVRGAGRVKLFRRGQPPYCFAPDQEVPLDEKSD
jgi:uncharacterized oligopeptide transporter (OPT) family protein